MDAAGFARREWLLAEFEEAVLAREALPAVANTKGRIDAAGGMIGG